MQRNDKTRDTGAGTGGTFDPSPAETKRSSELTPANEAPAAKGTETTAARRVRIGREIGAYMGGAINTPGLTPEQIGAMRSGERHVALLHSITLAAIRRVRETTRADPTEAVALIIACLSDGRDGACTASVKRIAEVLNRPQQRIKEAIKRLGIAGRVKTKRRRGPGGHEASAQRWPLILQWVVELNTFVWVLDALAARSPASSPAGRRVERSVDRTETGPQCCQTPPRPAPNPSGEESNTSSLPTKNVDRSSRAGAREARQEVGRQGPKNHGDGITSQQREMRSELIDRLGSGASAQATFDAIPDRPDRRASTWQRPTVNHEGSE